MNWSEYVRVLVAFQDRVGADSPPSILSASGALQYMKRALVEDSTPHEDSRRGERPSRLPPA